LTQKYSVFKQTHYGMVKQWYNSKLAHIWTKIQFHYNNLLFFQKYLDPKLAFCGHKFKTHIHNNIREN